MSELHPIPSADDVILTDCAAIELYFLLQREDKSESEIKAACQLSTVRFNNARRVLRKAGKLVTSADDVNKFMWMVTE